MKVPQKRVNFKQIKHERKKSEQTISKYRKSMYNNIIEESPKLIVAKYTA